MNRGSERTTGTVAVGNASLIESLLSYKNSAVIAKYAKQEGIPLSEAQEHFTEMLKFLYMSYISHKPCSPSLKVDAVWHSFILFTRDYREFCLEYFDGFIDHTPHSDKESDKKVGNDVAATYAMITSIFGEDEASKTLWTTDSICDSGFDSGNCSASGPGGRYRPTGLN